MEGEKRSLLTDEERAKYRVIAARGARISRAVAEHRLKCPQARFKRFEKGGPLLCSICRDQLLYDEKRGTGRTIQQQLGGVRA